MINDLAKFVDEKISKFLVEQGLRHDLTWILKQAENDEADIETVTFEFWFEGDGQLRFTLTVGGTEGAYYCLLDTLEYRARERAHNRYQVGTGIIKLLSEHVPPTLEPQLPLTRELELALAKVFMPFCEVVSERDQVGEKVIVRRDGQLVGDLTLRILSNGTLLFGFNHGFEKPYCRIVQSVENFVELFSEASPKAWGSYYASLGAFSVRQQLIEPDEGDLISQVEERIRALEASIPKKLLKAASPRKRLGFF